MNYEDRNKKATVEIDLLMGDLEILNILDKLSIIDEDCDNKTRGKDSEARERYMTALRTLRSAVAWRELCEKVEA
jgi:hypothetical protein